MKKLREISTLTLFHPHVDWLQTLNPFSEISQCSPTAGSYVQASHGIWLHSGFMPLLQVVLLVRGCDHVSAINPSTGDTVPSSKNWAFTHPSPQPTYFMATSPLPCLLLYVLWGWIFAARQGMGAQWDWVHWLIPQLLTSTTNTIDPEKNPDWSKSTALFLETPLRFNPGRQCGPCEFNNEKLSIYTKGKHTN